jgi:hypothetical protein
MLNVQNLTNTLSRMELPDLQKYAAMHKNDPYVVSLALSIANQKKQMMVGKAGQAGMQPQPKVVDQQIAQMAAPPPQQMAAAPQQQMLPEDTGIGQLPAQNMQNMAEGGIVAFEDGGEVPRMFNGGVPPRPVQRIPGDPIALEWDRKYGATHAPDGMLKASKQQYILDPASKSYIINPQYVASPAASVKPAVPAPAPPPPAAPPPPPLAAKPAAPAAPVPAAAPIDPLAGLTALDTKAPTVEAAIADAKKLGDDTEVRKKLEEHVASQKEAGEKSIKAFETGIAALPKSYEKYEARLQKEEAEAATDKQKAMGMSIFKAGLAMMSGTSQNAFENIGKGAMVGLEDQQAALKDFKKAQRERDKAFADIEASRVADQRGDLKTKLDLENRAADRNVTAQGKMIDGIAKLFDTNTTNARGIYTIGLENVNKNKNTMYTTGADIGKQRMADATALQRQRESDAAALERTRMQANAPGQMERIYRDPTLFSKHMEATTAATGMRGDAAHRETWAKSPYLQMQYPKIEDYLRAMGVIAPVNLPANAPVLP